jgi:hypothetical protein
MIRIAYVDAKMAELRSEAALQSTNSHRHHYDGESANAPSLPGSAELPGAPQQRHAAGAGKLMEIDLGPATTLQNIARTKAATRRLRGDGDAATDEPDGPAKWRRKPRLGPDGKPWRGRRNRRTSEDVARDKLVEDLMRESRLDIYEATAAAAAGTKGADVPAGMDEAADERLAERFKQDFLDSQVSRRKAAVAPPARPGEEKTKGPKLGGSRSARAAMAKALEEAAKSKKK